MELKELESVFGAVRRREQELLCTRAKPWRGEDYAWAVNKSVDEFNGSQCGVHVEVAHVVDDDDGDGTEISIIVNRTVRH